MTDRDKLIELLKGAENKVSEVLTKALDLDEWLSIYADYLLANGVIVPQQGKWEIKRDDCDFEYMMCSCCKEEFFPEGCVVEITPNFCPNCGARMLKELGK